MPPIYQDVSTRKTSPFVSRKVERARALGKRVQVLAISKWPATNQARRKKRDETKHVTLFVEESKGIQTFQGAMLKQFVSLDSILDL